MNTVIGKNFVLISRGRINRWYRGLLRVCVSIRRSVTCVLKEIVMAFSERSYGNTKWATYAHSGRWLALRSNSKPHPPHLSLSLSLSHSLSLFSSLPPSPLRLRSTTTTAATTATLGIKKMAAILPVGPFSTYLSPWLRPLDFSLPIIRMLHDLCWSPNTAALPVRIAGAPLIPKPRTATGSLISLANPTPDEISGFYLYNRVFTLFPQLHSQHFHILNIRTDT